MSQLQTSRDLYDAVTGLAQTRPPRPRDLEQYLGALRLLAHAQRTRPDLSLDAFFQLLSGALDGPAPPFDDAWRSRYDEDFADLPGFEGWEACVLRQIVDLREMAEGGMLDDGQRDFGVTSPRGERWYNFDPYTFLECATAGTYGGWEADAPPAVIPSVSWDDFRSFLLAGQCYE